MMEGCQIQENSCQWGKVKIQPKSCDYRISELEETFDIYGLPFFIDDTKSTSYFMPDSILNIYYPQLI